MKYVKMLGLLAVAAAALMAFVGTASATVTSPKGTPYNGTIKATSTNSKLTGSVEIACTKSTVEGTVSNGSTTGTVTSLTFEGCGNDTVTAVTNPTDHDCGHLTIHSDGTLTSTGCKVTVQLHRTVIGFPVTTHCIYKTNNTVIGKLTEGVAPAVMHIGEAEIDQEATDGACGEDAIWTGTYTVTTPTTAIEVH